LAFAWKLASLGVPTVLVYLGFIGDVGISDAGSPFMSVDEWTGEFDAKSAAVFPKALHGVALNCGPASMRLLVRSRHVLGQSPKRVPRKQQQALLVPSSNV
jgi:hypothetical protein